ncbi:MAG: isopentenyl-diphosphate Delta-isomerase [Candidatus Pacebacteria bacterium]|nr:isopentenyl-diphosphate Delta-isomerase [Candidatus Paceibacterota bacterium]
MTDKSLDRVILVDENDQVIGQEDKVEAHRGQGQRHRAVSVFLFNSEGELLIQRRSQYKIVAAGKWGNTVCGNVRPGESYEDCAQRRLQEELGIREVRLKKIDKFSYHVEFENGFSENEIDTIFAGKLNQSPQPNPQEVSEYQWIEFDSFASMVVNQEKTDMQLVPWLEKIFDEPQILKKLKDFC